MLISIIIPCYNAEKFVGDAIQSALQQTFKEKEIICINNASNDRTEDVLIKYKSIYPNLIIVNEFKNGASAARNRGLFISKGEYIQFLDADDLLEPNKLEKQVEILKSSKDLPDFIASEGVMILPSEKKTINLHIEENAWFGLFTGKLGNTCSNLFKKSALISIDGWNEQMQSSQETELMYRLLKNNASVIFDHNERAVIRKINESSISASDKKNNYLRYVDLRLNIFSHLDSIGYYDSHDIYPYLNFLFDIIRILYRYNPEKSVEYHKILKKKKFTPHSNSTKETVYKMLYNILGFKNSERFYEMVRTIYGSFGI